MFSLTLVGLPKGAAAQRDIDLGIAVYFKDRPPVKDKKTIKMFALAGIQPGLPSLRRYARPLDRSDVCLFRHPPSGAVLDQWQGRYSSEGPLFQYKKVRVERALYQLVFVNGKLRRVIADVNGDGLVDFELWKPDTEKSKLVKMIPTKSNPDERLETSDTVTI
jgi:hypothetical protein